MSLLRKITLTIFFNALAFSASAADGLYGFTSANPYTYEEQILDIKVAPKTIVNYREAMRKNIIALAEFAKAENKDFELIAHEGEELLHKSLWEYHLDGYNEARKKGLNADDPAFLAHLKRTTPEKDYSPSSEAYGKSISGLAVNNRFCGKHELNEHIKKHNLKLISIDYCKTEAAFDEAAMNATGLNYLLYAFIKPETAFKKIRKQPIINENAQNIFKVAEAQNISLFIDDSLYKDKERFLQDIRESNYDIVVIDPFFHHTSAYSKEDVESLKFKKNGAKRLIFAKINVSEADPEDYYWQNDWEIEKTPWLARASFTDENAVITQYWDENWRQINGRYFKGIVDSGYDGAFLTGIENHTYFEKQTPLE